MAARLGQDEIAAALATMPGWTLDGDGRTISRSYVFGDFSEAFAFMTRVALAAEKADHHPDWSNSWNRVVIALTTHSASGLTRQDVDLARIADAAAGPLALAPEAN